MSSDVSKCDQVVFECMQKVAEVIISSRVLQQHPKSGRAINSKFSLHVEELAFVRHSMEAWKGHLHMPLGIDVFWQEHQREGAAPGIELLERWEIMYEAQDAVDSKSAQLRHLYKRAIILLRTLYSFVRMVPAYQVHKRIQKAYDNRNRSLVDTRDDVGFCLYPILERGSGGSGLDFGNVTSEDKENATHSGWKASTGYHAFKPLEAPHGTIKIKVTYRSGAESKAYQQGQAVTTPTSSVAPNMTTSIIQDYVPDEYEGDQARQEGRDSGSTKTRASEGETHQEYWPRLASMPEDGATAPSTPGGVYGQEEPTERRGDAVGGMSGLGVALLERGVDEPASSGATIETRIQASSGRQHGRVAGNMDDPELGLGPDVLHWPSPEQGHGYADKRLHKFGGQGPAPFLTPGPHRHKFVPGGRQGHGVSMEPLDLGPTADGHPPDSHQPAAMLQSCGHGGSPMRYEQDDCGPGRGESGRLSSGDYYAGGAHRESRFLDTHGSVEGYIVHRGDALPLLREDGLHMRTSRQLDPIPDQRRMARAVGEVDGFDATMRPVGPMYRRNSISEAPMASAAPVPREQALLSLQSMRIAAGHRRSASSLHQGSTYSTPPFSYCDEVGSGRPTATAADGTPFRLGQPLVSFSPPFDADPGDRRVSDDMLLQQGGAASTSSPLSSANVDEGSEVRYSAQRNSLLALAASASPALLETLPESPFSWKEQAPGGIHPPVVDTASAAGRFSVCFPPPIVQRRLDNNQTQPQQTSLALAGVGDAEGLPFATDLRDDGVDALAQDPSVFGAEGSSDTKGALFALCSAASKSVFATQGSPTLEGSERPIAYSPERSDEKLAQLSAIAPSEATLYASAAGKHLAEEAEKTVRSLEEELDGFRQFHEELERQHP